MSEHNDAHKDLVKRLRRYAKAIFPSEHSDLAVGPHSSRDAMLEAADTIERLTASAPVDGDFRGAVTEWFNTTDFNFKEREERSAAYESLLALLPARTPEPDADVVVVKRSDMEAAYIAAVHSQGYPTVNTLRNKLQIWLSAANLLRTPAGTLKLSYEIEHRTIVAVSESGERYFLSRRPAGRPDREAVARIINPDAFDYEWLKDCRGNHAEEMRTIKEQNRAVAFEKAVKIDALYPAAPSPATGGKNTDS